jgi:hypothetical protein
MRKLHERKAERGVGLDNASPIAVAAKGGSHRLNAGGIRNSGSGHLPNKLIRISGFDPGQSASRIRIDIARERILRTKGHCRQEQRKSQSENHSFHEYVPQGKFAA